MAPTALATRPAQPPVSRGLTSNIPVPDPHPRGGGRAYRRIIRYFRAGVDRLGTNRD